MSTSTFLCILQSLIKKSTYGFSPPIIHTCNGHCILLNIPFSTHTALDKDWQCLICNPQQMSSFIIASRGAFAALKLKSASSSSSPIADPFPRLPSASASSTSTTSNNSYNGFANSITAFSLPRYGIGEQSSNEMTDSQKQSNAPYQNWSSSAGIARLNSVTNISHLSPPFVHLLSCIRGFVRPLVLRSVGPLVSGDRVEKCENAHI